MGKYTVYGKNIDSKIQAQLDKICKVIANRINPISILLIGGFGRGEGSIIMKKNKFIPINDYDIYAITQNKVSNPVLERISLEASRAIGKKGINFEDFTEDMEYDVETTFYPDIRVITLAELKKLPPFLKYYEIKYGATTIYGKNILHMIPEMDINNVPSPEGFRFLMNRISLSIMHLPHSVFKEISTSDKERLINFNSKVAFALAESLLIYSRKYQVGYKKRADILKKTYNSDFPELHNEFPKLPEIVSKYTNQKLKPNYKKIKDPLKDWFLLREYSFEVVRYLLFKFIGKKAKSVRDVSKLFIKEYPKYYLREYIQQKFKIPNVLSNLLVYPANFVLNLLFILRIFESKKKLSLTPITKPFVSPDMKIFSGAFSLIHSIDKKGELDPLLFSKSWESLNTLYPIPKQIKQNPNWESSRELFGTIFNLYGFQRLI